jgi:CubicO group peptidase (beta-lactamase class C family)
VLDAEHVLDAVRPHIGASLPGAVVGVLHRGAVSIAAAGALHPDVVVRISSNTKPIVAALSLALVEDGVLSLDAPVELHVPELAARRVLRRPGADLDDTAVERAAALGLGFGPPDPALPLSPDEWIARFAELPLLEQPGTAWRYEISFAVLGVVLARAADAPLDVLLRERVLDRLAMASTGFRAAPDVLPPAYRQSEDGLVVFDPGGADSRWTAAPAFPDARGGLVATAHDLLRFAAMLLAGGAPLLSPESVQAMTTDALTVAQRAQPSAAPFLDGGGWGHGVGVAEPLGVRGRRYGWAGGLGTLWWSYPEHDTAAVLLTQVLPPVAPAFAAFTAALESALDA